MTENGSGIGKAILEVMGSVGYVQKQSAAGLQYTYASESALIAALRPAMIKAGVFCYIQEIPSIEQLPYVTSKGTAMNRTIAHGIVRFSHPESKSYIDVHAMGEGADIGDKAGNMAATGLLKYALRQTFLIETGDDPDQHSSKEQERLAPKVIGESGSAANAETSNSTATRTTGTKKTKNKPSKKRPQKVGEDAVTMFWALAKKLELTPEQAQQVVDDQSGNFVDAYDALSTSNVPPEDK